MRQAYGFIETVGLAAAIEASDIALKSANVELIGLELTKGFGYTTVKLQGSVSSVKAGVDSVKGSRELVGKIVSTDIIPRPSEDLDLIVLSGDNLVMDRISQDETGDRVPELEEGLPEEELEEEVEEEVEENQITILEDEDDKEEYTCNLCEDPLCQRHKGEPRDTCIHHEE